MEFDLIERIRRRATQRDDVVLGIGDDAAVLRVPAGHELVVSTDTLNEGVHFPSETTPADVGWKTLAVNLSDLAAMGAAPAWCTLSLCLPRADEAWLDRFLDGFLALAQQHAIALVGGDTTRGPLSISVTAQGFVPQGQALLRAGAQVGDEIWVTGTLGDAAGALRLLSLPSSVDVSAIPNPHPGPLPVGEGEVGCIALRARLDRPTPRLGAGLALRGLATACIDVSDGLLADLGHVLRASRVGARLDLERVPASDALRDAFADRDARLALQLGGGDDYELCFTAPLAQHDEVMRRLHACDTPATVIGAIEAGSELRVLTADGDEWRGARAGWDHFAA